MMLLFDFIFVLQWLQTCLLLIQKATMTVFLCLKQYPMKVMKAMKNLRFWSRKKRKRKQSSPSSQTHQCSYAYSSAVPIVEINKPLVSSD
ncbi:hypothetical protein N665_0632s0015 [Sinapis alba]|nr:hypothetical protein N665_0632s0015 [Sinapis alba]